jgi:hypothetical protein
MLNTRETQTVSRSRLTTMAAGISLALATLPGAALAAPSAWEGFATITAATPQCSGGTGTGAGLDGTATGAIHVSIFRPKIAGTDPRTFLSFVFLRAALTLEKCKRGNSARNERFGQLYRFWDRFASWIWAIRSNV